MGLNCVLHVYMDFFNKCVVGFLCPLVLHLWIEPTVDHRYYFPSRVGVRSWAAHVCVVTCILHEGLEHQQILVSSGVLEPIPVYTEG